MSNVIKCLCVVCLMSLLGFYAWVRLAAALPPLVSSSKQLATAVAVDSAATPEHKVTPKMTEETAEKAGLDAPDFSADATDGKTYHLAEATKRGPVVLLFIKDGCPCSTAAQPFFNRLSNLYSGTQFFGVINGDIATAKEWGTKHRVPFPILADADLKIVHAYEAERSAYSAVVLQGVIMHLWPGYSAAMLNEMGELLSKATNQPLIRVDTKNAPEEPFSGCSF